MNKLIKKEIARVKTFHRTFLLLMVFANVMIEANFKSQRKKCAQETSPKLGTSWISRYCS